MKRFGRVSLVYGLGGAALALVGLVLGVASGDWGLAAFCVLGLAAIAASFYFDPRVSGGQGHPPWQYAMLALATVVLMVAVYAAT